MTSPPVEPAGARSAAQRDTAAAFSSSRPSSSRMGSATGLFRRWKAKASASPAASGRGSSMMRSMRPGRSSASSRFASGTDVAARMITAPGASSSPAAQSRGPPARVSSICIMSSDSNRVTAPPSPEMSERCDAMASTWSRKRMHGAMARAASKSSATRRSEAPTAACRMSGQVTGRNRTPKCFMASAAMARTSVVLPVPGAPCRRTPPGLSTPSRAARRGCRSGRSTAAAASATCSPAPGSGL
mmetsp:Transcript_33810/g.106809  ORF Transcript_33810/g.106809 Transcript_33810/m.106809 type:complete len:244 (+) Transcript_33810:217-948(+)